MAEAEGPRTKDKEPRTKDKGQRINHVRKRVSDRKRAANRANARKSTGPRTAEGKRRSSQNARRLSLRLLGLAEARALNQDLGAAEQLYRELTAPYAGQLPPLVDRQFQDLARLYLELEAWERIRDASVEHRWQQADIEKRRNYHEMEADLPGTIEQIFQNGVVASADSPAKFKMELECLDELKSRLEKRDFSHLEATLYNLYGLALNPAFAQLQTICIRCDRLMKGQELSEADFQGVLKKVEKERKRAGEAYVLQLDAKTMTRAACVTQLGPSYEEDNWLDRRGERLRHAIDRKMWLINGLLQTFGLANPQPRDEGRGTRGERRETTEARDERARSERRETRDERPTCPSIGNRKSAIENGPPSPPSKIGKTKPRSPSESTKRPKKRAKTKPNEPKSAVCRVSAR